MKCRRCKALRTANRRIKTQATLPHSSAAMRRAMLLATCARALRHARPARPRLTATYRQRVGASDEARLALKEYSEFGQEPIPENTSEEDVTLTGDAAVVRRAVGILAPHVSTKGETRSNGSCNKRTRHLSVAFERPSNPPTCGPACGRLTPSGAKMSISSKISLEEAAKRAAARGVHADPTQSMRGRKKRMTSAMGAQKWLSLEAHSDAQALVSQALG